MKVKVRIDTMSDVRGFVEIVNQVPGKVRLTSEDGLCINAKSFLGVAHAAEFDNIWCVSDNDIYTKIEKFIIID